MNWQPIDTAPKDGTPILVFCRGYSRQDLFYPITVVYWYLSKHIPGGGVWQLAQIGGYAGDGDPDGEPTHWSPLPAPPIES